MIVACVCVGSKYTEDYVDKLESSIARHTSYKYNFMCLRHSTRPGWWAKLDLFKIQHDRILYFDLDTVIVGDLDPLFSYNGNFAIIKNWWGAGFQSSVFSIAPSYGRFISDEFKPEYMPRYHSDQEWITECVPDADIWPSDLIGSYKAHSLKEGSGYYRAVCFHGRPKPHEIEDKWVVENWRV